MAKKAEDKFEWFRRTYGVPAKLGAAVRFQGQAAKVVGTRAQYLRLKFDDQKSVSPFNFHPTCEMDWSADAPSPPAPLPHQACGRGETESIAESQVGGVS